MRDEAVANAPAGMNPADRGDSYVRAFRRDHAPLVESHRSGGACPVDMLIGEVPPGETFGAATASFAVSLLLAGTPEVEIDVGAGRFAERCRPGHMAIQVPGEKTRFVVRSRVRCMVFSAPVARFAPLLADLPGAVSVNNFGRLHTGGLYDPYVQHTLRLLWDELASSSPNGDLFVDQAAMALFARMLRLAEQVPQQHRGGLAPWQLKRVTDYLEAHLANDIRLDELAALVGLSTFHFCRAFKQTTGLPPFRWRQMQRIERACSLLQGTHLSVTGIAATVGYSDPSQFALAFRKVKGFNPSDYRKQRRT